MVASSVVHRARESPWPAVSMDDALRSIDANFGDLRAVEKKIGEVRSGDVIAQEVRAKHPHPRFRISRMDGYALKAADPIGNLRLLGAIPAGRSARRLEIPLLHCFRINTGGIVPDSADAVIPVEFTKLVEHNDEEELVIETQKKMEVGQNIREVGSDIPAGELLISEGAQLGAAEIGLLANAGCSAVRVFRRPTVGVLSTGDELVDLDETQGGTAEIPEGKILDSNRPMLVELLRSRGFEVRDCGIVADKREVLEQNICDHFAHCDVLVSSGGVSMGDKDLLKDVLQHDLRFDIHFGRVFMKPGLPSTFATGEVGGKKCVFFGLPGNPVSAFVSTHLFVLPMLRRRSGCSEERSRGTTIKVKLGEDVRLDARPEYVRAHFEANAADLPTARIISSNQVSSRLLSVTHANLLLALPPRSGETAALEKGDVVDAIVIDWL
ncbi:Gephyrin [Aphelenchoides fujianensis]|nr:Gephyrin [Aphelenchoides fujianensis]